MKWAVIIAATLFAVLLVFAIVKDFVIQEAEARCIRMHGEWRCTTFHVRGFGFVACDCKEPPR
jgi:hypothetical protein